MREGLRRPEEALNWKHAATAASNLSQTELLVGEIGAATAAAEKAVAFADRAGSASEARWTLTALADSLHAAGEWEKAETLFSDAERRQYKQKPKYPLLYSLRGYRYCDLLLSHGQAAAARNRASQAFEIARRLDWVLAMALDRLTLGRANLALTLQSLPDERSVETVRGDARAAAISLNEAIEGVRASGQNNYVPRGLLARAACRRAIGNWEGAARDLDETEEIAEPGPMRLFLL